MKRLCAFFILIFMHLQFIKASKVSDLTHSESSNLATRQDYTNLHRLLTNRLRQRCPAPSAGRINNLHEPFLQIHLQLRTLPGECPWDETVAERLVSCCCCCCWRHYSWCIAVDIIRFRVSLLVIMLRTGLRCSETISWSPGHTYNKESK